MIKQLLIFLLIIGFEGFAQSNKISEFKIEGAKKLKESFVKKIALIEVGDALDSLVIAQDIISLKRLPSVSHADFEVTKTLEGYFEVVYKIQENFTLIPSVNIYTTDDDEFAYRLGLYEFNALGRNITFGGFYQRDIFDSYAINFRAPYLFSNTIGLAVNLQDLTTQEPIFFDNTSANYKYNNRSVEVLGLYQFNFSNRLELGFNIFEEAYKYQSGATSADVPQQYKIPKWMIKGIYEYNNLDYFYQYVSGFKSQFNFQFVTSSSHESSEFFIGWNDFLYFKRVGEKGNWANRLRLGLANNDDTPFAPFSVDNNLNVRGVGNTIDRGTGVIVLNTEYRYTLLEKDWFILQGNSFVDAGTWRNAGGRLSDFGKTKNIKIYPGVGLRLTHKKIYNATFRIDYGYGITKGATKGLVFGIGQYF
ncbi:outer membrane protein assembly factor [Algibacter miyuki]|uniref:Outer membrane protein assembly factor n=1 Tax=Algibacter miyuki TaxID=1306933 RepID=A0ABV5H186_9FLAO|nr:outer membrane protein assembly factor [Algibacter miyuki]MDN3666274.1 outer membrane protein assembly factor [Algibacter miyuki]